MDILCEVRQNNLRTMIKLVKHLQLHQIPSSALGIEFTDEDKTGVLLMEAGQVDCNSRKHCDSPTLVHVFAEKWSLVAD